MNSPKKNESVEIVNKDTTIKIKKSTSQNNLFKPNNYHDKYIAKLDSSALLRSKKSKNITPITDRKTQSSSKNPKDEQKPSYEP